MQQAYKGHDLGLISEAGLPAVADPGSSVVAAAHRMGIAVLPLAGSSAIVLALAASGLHGQHFSFHGYLPQDANARKARLQQLEQRSALEQGSCQIFMDTPYRNTALLQACLSSLHADTQLAICAGLLSPAPYIASHRIAHWQSTPVDGTSPAQAALAYLPKIPALFLLQAKSNPQTNPAKIPRLPKRQPATGNRSGR